jgi:pilus assembly protein CpaF
MFSIIITEKGGTERRESYDRTEINVGRVQGNDLMLPKGNVSKRHARLLFRDGRFIVTDLKSTNGTYVNGRKIAQATIVREGDKIYIGDFVLRIEMAGTAGASPSQDVPLPSSDPSSEGRHSPSSPLNAAELSRATAPPMGAPSAPPAAMPPPTQQAAVAQPAPQPVPAPAPMPAPAPPPGPPPQPVQPNIPQPAPLPSAAMGPAPAPSTGQPLSAQAIVSSGPVVGLPPGAPEGISHFPLERDPDDGAYGSVPSPPRVPSGASPVPPNVARPSGLPARPSAAPALSPQPSIAASPGGPAVSPIAPQPVQQTPPLSHASGVPSPPLQPRIDDARGPASMPIAAPSSPGLASAVPPPNAAAFPPVPPSAQRKPPTPEDRADQAKAAARRALVAKLVEGLEAKVDLRPIAQGDPVPAQLAQAVDRALRDVAGSMGSEGPGATELDQALADAKREVCELGPLGPWLDDEDVSEIQIVRHDHVLAVTPKKTLVADVAFASPASLDRVLRRLCARAGKPLENGETFVDRRLDRGARMFAAIAQVEGGGTMITIRKPQRADQTLDDLVRAGAISRVVASFLAQAVTARANILVTGAFGSGAKTLLGALAAAGSLEDRLIVLQEDDELIFNQPHTVSLLLGDTAGDGAKAVRAALRAHPDRLVIGSFAGHVVTEVVDAVGDGIEGVMAAARAPTLRHLVARLPADIAATRGGISLDVAREWLASAFDLVIEVAKLRDGRVRVLRVGELVHENAQLVVRDVFAFVVERMATGGAVEGSFVSTGHVPHFAEDLAQRGAAFDPALFKPTSKGTANR